MQAAAFSLCGVVDQGAMGARYGQLFFFMDGQQVLAHFASVEDDTEPQTFGFGR